MPSPKTIDDDVINNLDLLLNIETLEESDLWSELVNKNILSDEVMSQVKKTGGIYE